MKSNLLLLLTLSVALSSAVVTGQSQGRGQGPASPRVTPLGTQRPKTDLSDGTSNANENREKAEDVVERALNGHGGRQAWLSIQDYVGEGTLTFYSGTQTKTTTGLSLIRKGNNRVQRIIRQPNGDLHQGTDGTSAWESAGGFVALAPGGLAATFIESQTVRGPSNLFDAAAKGNPVRNTGKKNEATVLEVEDKSAGAAARRTRYSIDAATSRITRIEFATGEVQDLFGKTVPSTESYVFADFRTVQGIPTAFRVTRYIDGQKIEEMQFSSVRYNTSVKDNEFKP